MRVPNNKRAVAIYIGIVRRLTTRSGVFRIIRPLANPIKRFMDWRFGKKNRSPNFCAAGILEAVKIKIMPNKERTTAQITMSRL